MENYYDKWLHSEMERYQVIRKAHRKKQLIQTIFLIPICILALVGINLISGGDFKGAMNLGIRYGAAFGGCVTLLMLLTILLSNQPGRFQKQAAKECKRQLPERTQQEEFAIQMLGQVEDSPLIKLVFQDNHKNDTDFVSISKDYIAWSTAVGYVWFARLKDTSFIELDTKEYQHTYTAGEKRITNTETMYPISFYYHNNSTLNTKKKKPDQIFFFDKKSYQTQVADAINKISEINLGE